MPRGENFKGRKPPNSGRKSGTRNKLTQTLKQKAAAHSDDAITTLAEIMSDQQQPGAVRVAAADKLLDRAHGKPTVSVETEVDVRAIPWDDLRKISEQALEESEKQHREIIEGRAERLGLKIDYTSDDKTDD